jgi:integrase
MEQQPRLLDQTRQIIRLKHYSIRTERAYVDWIKRVILFHHKRHSNDMGAPEVEAFLTHLAVEQHVAASTQQQALSAILFLYREVLHQTLPWMDNITRAKKPKRLPVVLTQAEVRAVLSHLDGQTWLMTNLLYGAGLRLMECVWLRIKDVDFGYRQLIVQDGKGQQDRVTMGSIRPFLRPTGNLSIMGESQSEPPRVRKACQWAKQKLSRYPRFVQAPSGNDGAPTSMCVLTSGSIACRRSCPTRRPSWPR